MDFQLNFAMGEEERFFFLRMSRVKWFLTPAWSLLIFQVSVGFVICKEGHQKAGICRVHQATLVKIKFKRLGHGSGLPAQARGPV